MNIENLPRILAPALAVAAPAGMLSYLLIQGKKSLRRERPEQASRPSPVDLSSTANPRYQHFLQSRDPDPKT